MNLQRHASERGKIAGYLTIEVRSSETGELLRRINQKNLIVDTGFLLLCDLLAGIVSTPLSHFGYGTDSTAAAAGQTALLAEVFRSRITQYDTTTTPKVLVVKHYLSSTQANGNTLREAGLLTAPSSGVMFSRTMLSSPITKTTSVTVTATWTFTWS